MILVILIFAFVVFYPQFKDGLKMFVIDFVISITWMAIKPIICLKNKLRKKVKKNE